jgi:hypothetical protein
MLRNTSRSFNKTHSVSIFSVIVFFAFIHACSSDETTGPQDLQIVDIAISPESASFGVGEEVEFSAVALTATGETVDISDLNIMWDWWSTDPDVFTVEPGGLATGQNEGEAWCVVEAVVDVSQELTQPVDRIIVQANVLSSVSELFPVQKINIELDMEHINMKNMMRFTGRDSAFVVIF